MQHVETVGGQPVRSRRRWPRILAAVAALFAALLAAGFWSGLVAVYDAPGNAGVVVGWDCTNAGYEWRGTPGFFFDECG
jgi:hypothetical protein